MNSRLPSLGPVVLSFNHGQFLSQALKSIFTQKNVLVKVALCVAESSDQTLPIADLYKGRVAFFRSHLDGASDGYYFSEGTVNEGLPDTCGGPRLKIHSESNRGEIWLEFW